MGAAAGLVLVFACLAPASAGAATTPASLISALGGLLPIGSSTCTLCANLVTTSDRDGTSGPAAPVTRMHHNLIVNAPYAIDVDGTLPDLPLGILPLPGYELSVTVQALSADKPTIKISKLAAAPLNMPLRAEIVTGDVGTPSASKTSLGYDTLDSTAPQAFTAVLDLTDRDANPTTVNALANLTLTTLAARTTLVTEGFSGDAAGTRTDRHIRRLTYRGNAAQGTAVPAHASLDVTASNTSQHAILTHDLRTVLDVNLDEPGTGTDTTATLDELPATTQLNLDDTDVNGDGEADKKVSYTASAPVKKADLKLASADSTSTASVNDLPSTAAVTYANGTGGTAVTYHSNGRATHAELHTDSAGKKLNASLDNVPANIDDLHYTPTPTGGHVVVHTDGSADNATVEALDGAKQTKAVVAKVPADIDIDWDSTNAGGTAHYVGDSAAKTANIDLADDQGQKTAIDLGSGTGTTPALPKDVKIAYTKGSGKLHFDYTADADVPAATIKGTDFRGLPDRAKQLLLDLKRVPTGVGLDVQNTTDSTSVVTELPPPQKCTHEPHPEDDPDCPQSGDDYRGPPHKTVTTKKTDNNLSVTTPGAERLGSGEIQMTSGPDDRLEATSEKGNPEDGVLLHDLKDRYVVHARVSEFDELQLQRHNQVTTTTQPGLPVDPSSLATMHASLDTAAPDHALGLDIQKQGDTGPLTSTNALLVSLPSHIALDTKKSSGLGEDRTDWTASSPVDGWTTATIDGVRRPGFELTNRTQPDGQQATITSQVHLDPMPTSFSACKHNLDACSGGRFDENLQHLHDHDVSYRTFACVATGCGGGTFPISPGDARNGSFSLESSQPTNMGYVDGDFNDKHDPFTTVRLTGLRAFGLQGHKDEFSCDFDQVTCKKGYVALDTGGFGLTGEIVNQTEDSYTRFNFPDGFHAHDLVWAFLKNGLVSGRLATIGSLNCPDGTQVQVGGETINERFCDGDIFDGTILDQL